MNTNFFDVSRDLRFLKELANLMYSGNGFFKKSFIWLVETLLFLLVEAIIDITGETVFKGRFCYC